MPPRSASMRSSGPIDAVEGRPSAVPNSIHGSSNGIGAAERTSRPGAGEENALRPLTGPPGYTAGAIGIVTGAGLGASGARGEPFPGPRGPSRPARSAAAACACGEPRLAADFSAS